MVTFDYLQGVWTIGDIGRLAWVDVGVWDYPVAVDASNNLFAHETGLTDNGSLMDAYVEYAPYEFNSGGNILNIHSVLADQPSDWGAASITFKSRFLPTDTETTSSAYNISSTDMRQPVRVAGRQHQVRFATKSTTEELKLGTSRFEVSVGGER
jgi:hypothetical protein